jgi:hypothetical protein
MTQTWKNDKGEPVIELEIDEAKGVTLKVNKELKAKHGKEIEELQTLNMYPPKNEDQVDGVASVDGEWTIYEFKKGKNWDYAKKDIVGTCEFWMNQPSTELPAAPLVVME